MTVIELGAQPDPEDAVAGAEDAGPFRIWDLVGSGLRLAASGGNAVRAAGTLSGETVRILSGRSDVDADRGDWRFTDPAWDRNPGYRRLKQLYLAWSRTLSSLADDADVDWRTRERARFAFGILTSAAAPTNTLPGNPAAVK